MTSVEDRSGLAFYDDDARSVKVDWHSFDATPWLHPWLSNENLSAMRDFSRACRQQARNSPHADAKPLKIGLVGNIANNMYIRAKAFDRLPDSITVLGLDGDDYLFSDPRWEEFDGSFAGGSMSTLENPLLNGVKPRVPYDRLTVSNEWTDLRDTDLPASFRMRDFRAWRKYYANLPGLRRLREFDVLCATQRPLLAYLANRPYAATPMGGDIWLESSRDDTLGRLQRLAFAKAGALFVSNPWIYAHARRYGMRNLIYLPYCLDETVYQQRPPKHREEWKAKTGGDFFVLSVSRMSASEKGSETGLRGFAEFAKTRPQARLVLLKWGNELEDATRLLSEMGISDRVHFIPVAGKQRVVEYYSSADCLLDQFKLGYFGSTALEAAACGLPCIMRIEVQQYDSMCETGAPPFLNAGDAQTIAQTLARLAEDVAYRRALSASHRQWFLDNHSGARWAEEYQAVLRFIAAGQTFKFEQSPLATPLTEAETEYQIRQLADAPPFPNYFKTKSEPAAAPKNPASDAFPLASAANYSARIAAWQNTNGRAPRVLVISTALDNKFMAAQRLRTQGVQCDVLCVDTASDLSRKPSEDWFVHGPLDEILPRLISQRQHFKIHTPRAVLNARRQESIALEQATSWRFKFLEAPETLSSAEILVHAEYFLKHLPALKQLFAAYDFVIASGHHAAMPLFAGVRFSVYDDGTFEDTHSQATSLARLRALTLATADALFCARPSGIPAARHFGSHKTRFGLFAPVHDQNWQSADELRHELQAANGCGFIILHPDAHNWDDLRSLQSDTANDMLVRAIASFVRNQRSDVLAIFVEQGESVGKSKALISSLGVEPHFLWITPQPNEGLELYVRASDVVASRLHAEGWSDVLPAAMRNGRPLLTRGAADPSSWNFSKAPPVFQVQTEAEILAALVQLMDWDLHAIIGDKARTWYDDQCLPIGTHDPLLALVLDCLEAKSEPRQRRATPARRDILYAPPELLTQALIRVRAQHPKCDYATRDLLVIEARRLQLSSCILKWLRPLSPVMQKR